MIQPTFNKLIELEVKEVGLALALSPKGVCCLVALNHGTLFSHVMSCQSILLCVHFGITDAHFCAFSFCKNRGDVIRRIPCKG